jgi:hemerythrin superfamily protein
MANAIELIKSDHRTVEQLFQRYRSLNGQTRQKQSIIQEVCHELTLHAQLEEEIFYPAVERQLGKEGASLVEEARKEHDAMKRAISQLKASRFTGPECDQVFQEMMKGVQHHVQEEETELLPQAQRRLGTESERLGTQMQQRKQELQHFQPGSGSQEREAPVND